MSAYVAPLRRALLVIAVAVPVLLVVAGGVWAGTRDKLIVSTTTLVVSPGGLVAEDPGLNVATTDLLRDDSAVATLAALAEDESVQQATLRAVGLDESAGGGVEIEIATPPQSSIVRVEVAAPSGEAATAAGNALVERITSDFERSFPVLGVAIVESNVDDEPSGGLPVLVGAIAGLVAGAVLSWLALSLRVYLSTRWE